MKQSSGINLNLNADDYYYSLLLFLAELLQVNQELQVERFKREKQRRAPAKSKWRSTRSTCGLKCSGK